MGQGCDKLIGKTNVYTVGLGTVSIQVVAKTLPYAIRQGFD